MGNIINKRKKKVTEHKSPYEEVPQETKTLDHLLFAFKNNNSTNALEILDLIRSKMFSLSSLDTFKGYICPTGDSHYQPDVPSGRFIVPSYSYWGIMNCCIWYVNTDTRGYSVNSRDPLKTHHLNITDVKPVWLALMFTPYDLIVNDKNWTKVFDELVELSDFCITDTIFGVYVYRLLCMRDMVITDQLRSDVKTHLKLKYEEKIFKYDYDKVYNKLMKSCDTVDLKAINNKGDTVLHIICKTTDGTSYSTKLIEKVLNLCKERNVNIINTKNNMGHTPLFEVVDGSKTYYNKTRIEIVELLLHYGADKDIKNADGKTIADIALDNKNYEMYKAILSQA